MNSDMELSIVVPVYNERDSVETLAREIDAALANFSGAWECIWVNDGSNDDTGAALCAYAADHPHHRVLALLRNSGQSAAIWTGIRQANGRIIGTLDGDGQNDPAEFPKLLLRLAQGDVDVVNGIRSNRADDLVRRISSKTANAFRRFFTGDTVSDIGCSLRVFRREFAVELPCFRAFHRFLPVLLAMRGARLCEMPVHHRPRKRGVSKYGVGNRLWVGLADTFGVCWMRRRLIWPELSDETACSDRQA